MREGRAPKHADSRVASMLRRALERVTASRAQVLTSVPPLQPALQRRIESRLLGAVAGN